MGRFVPRIDLVDTVRSSPAVVRGLRDLAEIGAAGARRRAPVGKVELAPVGKVKLRDSIGVDVDGARVSYGTNVEHGLYQELGTYKMAAQPFLRPSLDDIKAALRR